MASPRELKEFYSTYEGGYKLQKKVDGKWIDHTYGNRLSFTPDFAWSDDMSRLNEIMHFQIILIKLVIR